MSPDLIKAIAEPLAVAATLSSIFLMGRPGRLQRWGIVVSLAGVLPWTVFGIVTDSPFILAQNVVVTGLNLFNLFYRKSADVPHS